MSTFLTHLQNPTKVVVIVCTTLALTFQKPLSFPTHSVCFGTILTTKTLSFKTIVTKLAFIMETDCVLCEVRNDIPYIIQMCLSRRPEFDTELLCVRFVTDGVAWGQVCLPALQFSPVSTIPPMFHTYSFACCFY
jgi:hypothetical protein